jgi:DNA-binding transcriptional regulator YiaG
MIKETDVTKSLSRLIDPCCCPVENTSNKQSVDDESSNELKHCAIILNSVGISINEVAKILNIPKQKIQNWCPEQVLNHTYFL